MIALSQRMIAQQRTHLAPSDAPALPLLRIKTAVAALVIVLAPFTMFLAADQPAVVAWLNGGGRVFSIAMIAAILLYMLSPQIMLVVASNHRLKATCVVILATVFFFITAGPPLTTITAIAAMLTIAQSTA